MPIYEYVCDSCGKEFEFSHSMQHVRKKCPDCKKWKLRKLMSRGVGFRFKGNAGNSGFYELDYKRSNESDNSEGG